jgi:hypothetical protein
VNNGVDQIPVFSGNWEKPKLCWAKLAPLRKQSRLFNGKRQ